MIVIELVFGVIILFICIYMAHQYIKWKRNEQQEVKNDG